MTTDCDGTHCFRRRLATADRLVRTGAWASGLAIAIQVLDCSRHSGCDVRAECAAAADQVIGHIRYRVSPDTPLTATG